jgi:hypothetical protein
MDDEPGVTSLDAVHRKPPKLDVSSVAKYSEQIKNIFDLNAKVVTAGAALWAFGRSARRTSKVQTSTSSCAYHLKSSAH